MKTSDNDKAGKTLWFVADEKAHGTMYEMGVPTLFIVRDSIKFGMDDNVKEYITYFKGDLGQMWYRRGEFDASSEYLSRKIFNDPKWAFDVCDKVDGWSQALFKACKRFQKLDISRTNMHTLVSMHKKIDMECAPFSGHSVNE